MSTKSVQIGYVGKDRDFFQRVEKQFQKPLDNIFTVSVAEAESTPSHFDVGQGNLILVDWQVDVQAATPPSRLVSVIQMYASRGFRVAVVVTDNFFNQSTVGLCMEAGACSIFIKELSDYELSRWLFRLLQLPLRGLWAQAIVTL